MGKCERRVSFNNTVSVLRIPCKEDEWYSGPRRMTLAESMRVVVREMNNIEYNIQNDTGGTAMGEDDVIKRMVLSICTEPLSKIIYDHPSVTHIEINTNMDDVIYDDASLGDKVVLDFINFVVRGVSAKDNGDSDVYHSTLHILLNPSAHDLIGDMDHCLIVQTEAYGRKGGVPSIQMALDLRMDR